MTDVWVLTEEYPHEGEALYGVYASREDAERAAHDNHPLRDYDIWCIYKIEVGAPARWRGWGDREENKDDGA